VQRPVQGKAIELHVKTSVFVLESYAHPNPKALAITVLNDIKNVFQCNPPPFFGKFFAAV
jgi:hypothetical protein